MLCARGRSDLMNVGGLIVLRRARWREKVGLVGIYDDAYVVKGFVECYDPLIVLEIREHHRFGTPIRVLAHSGIVGTVFDYDNYFEVIS